MALDRQVERALLQGQQGWGRCVRPGALGEKEQVLAGMLYRVDGGGECLDRALAVAAVEEDGPRQSHEPAQNGNVFENLFCRDGRVFGEKPADQKHVNFILVVSENDT